MLALFLRMTDFFCLGAALWFATDRQTGSRNFKRHYLPDKTIRRVGLQVCPVFTGVDVFLWKAALVASGLYRP